MISNEGFTPWKDWTHEDMKTYGALLMAQSVYDEIDKGATPNRIMIESLMIAFPWIRGTNIAAVLKLNLKTVYYHMDNINNEKISLKK